MERKKYTDEEKSEIVRKIDALKSNGVSAADACAQAGVHDVSYYKWKKALGAKAKTRKPYTRRQITPNMQTLVVPEGNTKGSVFCFYGEPSQIAQTIRSLQ